jgi:hypothetical protein
MNGCHLLPGIRNAEELGIYYLGSPLMAITLPPCPIDRAGYGRELAAAEGGVFTPAGYIVPAGGEADQYGA